MNGHDYTRKYGGHEYKDHDGTSDCQHCCGCWAGPARSGGPLGLEPLGGECPNNPKAERLPGNDDYEIVVERRIRSLQSRAYNAERLLKEAGPGVVELAQKLDNTKIERDRCKSALHNLKQAIDNALEQM